MTDDAREEFFENLKNRQPRRNPQLTEYPEELRQRMLKFEQEWKSSNGRRHQ